MTRDNEIQAQFRDAMEGIAQSLDRVFNGAATGLNRKTGFVLLVFPFDPMLVAEDGQRCNYISNAEREDVIAMLKEVLARFEGYAEMKGTA